MKLPAAAGLRLSVPGALLVAFLQRAPALPVAAGADSGAFAARAGLVLRAAAAAVASLGALHTLAGATQLVVSAASVNLPVDTSITPVTFVVNGAPTPAQSYIITGLPPGLTVPGRNSATGILNVNNPQGSGRIEGTPTIAGSYPVTLQAWEFANATGNFSATVTVLFTVTAANATGQPRITTQPASLVTAVGQSATFFVGVTANPSASYQWLKNSVPIPNATAPAYTVPDVKLSDAANYVVLVTNAFGTVTSAAATLAVNAAPTPPVFAQQPQSHTVAPGATVALTGAATAVPSPTYQWWRGNKPIDGATSPTLVLAGTAVVAGTYSLIATNDFGAATSSLVTLTVATAADTGRLINLSILAPLAAGETMTLGTAIGGKDTRGPKRLLARAAGPALVQFGVANVLPDPKISLVAAKDGATFDTNNDWGANAAALAAAFAQVGAFPYAGNASKDAALFLEALPTGNYTLLVGDTAATASGTVIAELYDATPAAAFAPATPRLVNVSVLKQIASGTELTAGFVLGGSTARTVLVRAIGPGLAAFGVAGFMSDPKLALFNTTTGARLAENDNWGGDAQLTAVAKNVGAFALDDTASRDALLLVTLPPGNYSAAVTPAGPGGTALVEVYEVP